MLFYKGKRTFKEAYVGSWYEESTLKFAGVNPGKPQFFGVDPSSSRGSTPVQKVSRTPQKGQGPPDDEGDEFLLSTPGTTLGPSRPSAPIDQLTQLFLYFSTSVFARFDALDTRLDGMDSKFDDHFGSLENRVDDLRTDIHVFKMQQDRIERFVETVAKRQDLVLGNHQEIKKDMKDLAGAGRIIRGKGDEDGVFYFNGVFYSSQLLVPAIAPWRCTEERRGRREEEASSQVHTQVSGALWAGWLAQSAGLFSVPERDRGARRVLIATPGDVVFWLPLFWLIVYMRTACRARGWRADVDRQIVTGSRIAT
ncbi:hypothetical protein Taro_003841 [Colocasia esculenta]|uniref:Uncharacterized protein n=1 Tax=Colocasia esculenta TaxID=4460 RepID=A0A843TGL9_COLES|nr:hypothetical protein [Colocasia esculenta]